MGFAVRDGEGEGDGCDAPKKWHRFSTIKTNYDTPTSRVEKGENSKRECAVGSILTQTSPLPSRERARVRGSDA